MFCEGFLQFDDFWVTLSVTILVQNSLNFASKTQIYTNSSPYFSSSKGPAFLFLNDSPRLEGLPSPFFSMSSTSFSRQIVYFMFGGQIMNMRTVPTDILPWQCEHIWRLHPCACGYGSDIYVHADVDVDIHIHGCWHSSNPHPHASTSIPIDIYIQIHILILIHPHHIHI